MKTRNNRKTKVGKYILDTISIGMYNYPLMLIREYIQNSTDAIDEIVNGNSKYRKKAKIEVEVDGRERSITISDTGGGIPVEKTWESLHYLGLSQKKTTLNRGFRGIGRLGGLGYCRQLNFMTKAEGESYYSLSTWDCSKLRWIINSPNGQMEASDIIKDVSNCCKRRYPGNRKDHFFKVEMLGIENSRDILLDVPELKSYLSQVAPVPFDTKEFDFANMINSELKRKAFLYNTYNIHVNGEQIFKPYKNTLNLAAKNKDHVKDVEFIEFRNTKGLIAIGWVGKLQLLGTIKPSEDCDGIRVRHGNIQIGDKTLLSCFFRENRFNNYLIGEIHTADYRLKPNSRRDDFEDGDLKDLFCECFIKKIGLPYSRKIRELSQARSKKNQESSREEIIKSARKRVKRGVVSESQRSYYLKQLRKVSDNTEIKKEREKLEALIMEVKQANHFLDSSLPNVRKSRKELLRLVFEKIYRNCTDKSEAEVIILGILKHLRAKK